MIDKKQQKVKFSGRKLQVFPSQMYLTVRDINLEIASFNRRIRNACGRLVKPFDRIAQFPAILFDPICDCHIAPDTNPRADLDGANTEAFQQPHSAVPGRAKYRRGF